MGWRGGLDIEPRQVSLNWGSVVAGMGASVDLERPHPACVTSPGLSL